MGRSRSRSLLGSVGILAMCAAAHGQGYVGFVYPAGAQQGTTTLVRLGGQRIDGTEGAVVSGSGVEVKLVDYQRQLNVMEAALIREQLRKLQQASREKAKAKGKLDDVSQRILENNQQRIAAWENRPANRSVANLAFVEVTVAPDAEPGPREIRLVMRTGVSNPMPFYISQFSESAREPMKTCQVPVLGNEEAAERKRPPEEQEVKVAVPCVVNGQVAAGEINHYRFEAKKGQKLAIVAYARQLIPYIADAVPGWFQAVMTLYNAEGQEVAYGDVYRFKPDPVIHYEVPEDGEYVLTISDALFRGREDFVYRVSIAESPFITSIFPLGGRVGEAAAVDIQGWQIDGAKTILPPADALPGVHFVTVVKDGLVSNKMPFVLDALPEGIEEEPNNDRLGAQKVKLPVIVNGRINQPGDWDVFQFEGRAGQTVVAEVMARRLDSPLDSIMKMTDADGNLLAANDDFEDPGTGLYTHHADSYLSVELPSNGTYYVHLSDTAYKGGEEYGYRLRISEPQPDFELRVVPSAVAVRSKGSAAVSVYVIRRDGFSGDIQLSLKDPPEGFSSSTIALKKNQEMVRLGLKTTLESSSGAVALAVAGRAKIGGEEVVRHAVPADDHMQAFLWRHLVPVGDLKVRVFNPSAEVPSERVPPPVPDELMEAAKKAVAAAGAPKFSKRQVVGRVRMLDHLYASWLLTDELYHEKMAECWTPDEE
ncbi:MAG: PPC domain-containing protein [Patescibacteria group bacterium]|nr:PPC domain-containing protein [Patescibacteria group bacterium]